MKNLLFIAIGYVTFACTSAVLCLVYNWTYGPTEKATFWPMLAAVVAGAKIQDWAFKQRLKQVIAQAEAQEEENQ